MIKRTGLQCEFLVTQKSYGTILRHVLKFDEYKCHTSILQSNQHARYCSETVRIRYKYKQVHLFLLLH